MALSILYKITPVKIGELQVDASLSEQHSADVEATEHPVEDGAAITDHARERPETVSIEGVVSNTPIAKADRELAGDQVKGAPGRAQKALESLYKMKADGELLTIVTALRTYHNMLLVSLSIPRDAKQGDVLRFSAQFKQVRLVKSKITAVPKKPTGKNNKGKQSTKPADSPEAKKDQASAIKGILNDAGVTEAGSGVTL